MDQQMSVQDYRRTAVRRYLECRRSRITLWSELPNGQGPTSEGAWAASVASRAEPYPKGRILVLIQIDFTVIFMTFDYPTYQGSPVREHPKSGRPIPSQSDITTYHNYAKVSMMLLYI